MNAAHRPLPKRFQYAGDLTAEPEADKALRMLRGFRHFVGSKSRGVMCVELDGQALMVIKHDPQRHPNADVTPEATA